MPRKTVHFYLDNRCLSLSLGEFLSVQEHDKRIECYCFFSLFAFTSRTQLSFLVPWICLRGQIQNQYEANCVENKLCQFGNVAVSSWSVISYIRLIF